METIYSVEEVAAILKIQPFTVRKMFREKKLSGFKIGKAWRITESQLQAQIIQLQENMELVDKHVPSPPDIVEESLPPVDLEPQEPIPDTPTQSASDPSYRSLVLMTGSLLIFSETPGEEVCLDGERKGQTTLSLLDVEEGEHRLQVGDLTDKIMVLPDIETRVRSAGGVFNITTRSSTQTWWAETQEDINAQLVVQMENHSKLTGAILVLLAGEDAKATSRIFADYEFANHENENSITNIQLADVRAFNRDIVEGKVQLSNTLVRNESAVLFDGPITYVQGNHLEITIPKQHGLDKQFHQSFPITGDLSIMLSIAEVGMLLKRPIVRMKLEK